MSRSARWCFTHNNPAEWQPTWDDTTMSYLIWGLETAPTTNRQHIQGYVRFIHRRTMAVAKIVLGADQIHLEPAKGTELQNREYCSKENNFHEYGTFQESQGQQGHRTDLDTPIQMVMSGIPLSQVALTCPKEWVKFHAGLTSLQRICSPPTPISRDISTMILWGATGLGKTHRIRTTYTDIYVVRPGRDPWGSYLKQKEILFEEFNPEEWKIQEMLTYLDKWSVELNARYNNKQASWNKVFILSNLDPVTWYLQEKESIRNAFFRRVNYTIEIISREQELLLI